MTITVGADGRLTPTTSGLLTIRGCCPDVRRGGSRITKLNGRGPGEGRGNMINGAHIILYSTDAEADRVFIRDVLGFAGVDAGGGCLIFELPPSAIALHPTDWPGHHQLSFMHDSMSQTLADLNSTDHNICI